MFVTAHRRVLAGLLLAVSCGAYLGCGHETNKMVAAQTLVASGYLREDLGVSVFCRQAQTLYGLRISDGHYVFSNDLGNTWVDTGGLVLGQPGAFQQCQFLHGFKFLSLSDGRIFRAAPNDWINWTEVSVSARPPGTTFRPDNLVGNDTYLYYGNYNDVPAGSYVYRSADDGASWVEVLSVANARHVHGIAIDPHRSDHIFVNLGDVGSAYPGYGLWYSSSNGDAGTFVHLSSQADDDGIDMVFRGTGAPQDEILMESDGTSNAYILRYSNAGTPAPGPIMEFIVGDPNPPDGKGSWRGTGRCIALTSEGNLFWISKPEGAPDRHRTGIWMAPGPLLNQPVLLEEINFVPFAKTFEQGSYLFVASSRIRKPTFSLQ